MVTQHVAKYPLNHVTYAPAKNEVAMPNGLGDTFTKIHYMALNLGVKVTQYVAAYAPHHVSYASV